MRGYYNRVVLMRHYEGVYAHWGITSPCSDGLPEQIKSNRKMSFKRTSCALNGQTMINSEPNTCDVVCLGPPNSEEEYAQPTVSKDDIPVATFHPYLLNTTDEQFTSFVYSSTSQSPSNESAVVSVQEVGPLQKLVARDASCFAPKKSKTLQDKQMLVSRESGSTNLLDLRSERNFETGIDNERENLKETVQNDCARCYELQRISEAKDANITELTRKLNELTERHKMFIVSNCELNEENDYLKIVNQQLKLQVGEVKFENSQLRSEKENLLRQFAAQENQQRPERRRAGSSSSSLLKGHRSHPDTSNQCETCSSVIRDDLQEAIMLSCQQKSDVWGLQEKITHQNELIKMLCSQLQKMTGLGKPSSLNLHCQDVDIACVSQQEKLSSRLQKPFISNRSSTAFTRQDDATLVSQEAIDEDNDILTAREVIGDEDLYSRGVTCYAPSTSPWTKTQQKAHVVTSDTTFQSQSNDLERQKSQDQQPGLNMGCNIQESSTNWHPNNANVDLGAASPIENTMARAQMTCTEKRLLHSGLVACPFCGQEFLESSADFPHNFETHIATCTGLGDRQCPMCLKELPGLSQSEFENHVNDHFVPDFEVLAP